MQIRRQRCHNGVFGGGELGGGGDGFAGDSRRDGVVEREVLVWLLIPVGRARSLEESKKYKLRLPHKHRLKKAVSFPFLHHIVTKLFFLLS